ncbi:MAG TPA: hypothetical protein VFM69_15285 [Pricia sp.]|nr:hypothetical protein [Pricia sp.]
MRSILAVTVILFLSFNANAQIDGTRTGEIMARIGEMKAAVGKAEASVVGVSTLAMASAILPVNTPAGDMGLLAVKEIDLAILYKMKSNKIRRALSFTPGKKWLKWV